MSDLKEPIPLAHSKPVDGPLNKTPGSGAGVHDRSIGAIIAETRNLSADQVERVLQYQRERGIRFGEAAVALGYANAEDVLEALSKQFHYPYTPNERKARSPELVALNQPFSSQAEVFRAIRSQITMRLYREGDSRRALAVISPDTLDGKSYFTANLAVTLAQLGGRTLLVDADLRRPRQHEIFDVNNQAGLSSILSGRSEPRVIQQVEGLNSLFILPVGAVPPNPVELLERPAFGMLMRELAGKFDHVLVDTSASRYGADAAIVASRCGAALVLARQNQSRVSALQDLTDSLDGVSTTLVGTVMNQY
ncbi:polysaccharide biosynthesis tyrosine autokinase [Roseateles sp. L2-2]|uniref:polysaccharide biosynthesis tyrosine autokinase n=1 Tax=Roseateles TaxID=93681 RepID=UPI003D366A7C